MKTFAMNAANGKKVLLDVIPKIAKEDWTETIQGHVVRDKRLLLLLLLLQSNLL